MHHVLDYAAKLLPHWSSNPLTREVLVQEHTCTIEATGLEDIWI